MGRRRRLGGCFPPRSTIWWLRETGVRFAFASPARSQRSRRGRTLRSMGASRNRGNKPMSDGERLLAAYLRQQQLPYEFEVGELRRPDFQVHHPITRVVCEVYEPTVRLPPQAGPFDFVSPLRGAFQGRKRRQGAEARSAGVPYVVVLGSANSDVGLDVFSVAGAAFGNVGVSSRSTRRPAALVL